MTPRDKDWNPGTYHRFRGLRLRPALDLLRALPPLPDGAVVDLGCGSGTVGAALAMLGRPVMGVDASPAMLAEARATGTYAALTQADIAGWAPEVPPALIFSNAALHWLDGHDRLLPRLAGLLAPGGVLAVQVPHQNPAPSHQTWLRLVGQMFPGRVDPATIPGILTAPEYHAILSPLGEVTVWETEYLQRLDPAPEGHPVRRFTESTFGRPILKALTADEQAALIAAYETAVEAAYPRQPDGSVLFPFRRLFFTLVCG